MIKQKLLTADIERLNDISPEDHYILMIVEAKTITAEGLYVEMTIQSKRSIKAAMIRVLMKDYVDDERLCGGTLNELAR